VGFINDSRVVGFEWTGSAYHEILPPGQTEAEVTAITGAGKLIGYYTGNLMFSFYNGRYRQIAIPNAPGALILGVNNAGTIVVGSYSPSLCQYCSFVYQNNTLQLLQFPGSIETSATGVNDGGEVVGSFRDASGGEHGFTWTPPADPRK